MLQMPEIDMCPLCGSADVAGPTSWRRKRDSLVPRHRYEMRFNCRGCNHVYQVFVEGNTPELRRQQAILRWQQARPANMVPSVRLQEARPKSFEGKSLRDPEMDLLHSALGRPADPMRASVNYCQVVRHTPQDIALSLSPNWKKSGQSGQDRSVYTATKPGREALCAYLDRLAEESPGQ